MYASQESNYEGIRGAHNKSHNLSGTILRSRDRRLIALWHGFYLANENSIQMMVLEQFGLKNISPKISLNVTRFYCLCTNFYR